MLLSSGGWIDLRRPQTARSATASQSKHQELRHNIAQPVFKLPLELLVGIIKEACDDPLNPVTDRFLELSAVCRHWKAAIDTTPWLWTTWHPNAKSVHLLVFRSMRCPVKIDSFIYPVWSEAFTEAVTSQRRRWRTFELSTWSFNRLNLLCEAEHEFQYLDKVHIEVLPAPIGVQTDKIPLTWFPEAPKMPKLTTLFLEGMPFLWTETAVDLPCLETLEMKDTAIHGLATLLDVLASAVGSLRWLLKMKRIKLYPEGRLPSTYSREPIVLSKLRRFSIRGVSSHLASSLLQWVRAVSGREEGHLFGVTCVGQPSDHLLRSLLAPESLLWTAFPSGLSTPIDVSIAHNMLLLFVAIGEDIKIWVQIFNAHEDVIEAFGRSAASRIAEELPISLGIYEETETSTSQVDWEFLTKMPGLVALEFLRPRVPDGALDAILQASERNDGRDLFPRLLKLKIIRSSEDDDSIVNRLRTFAKRKQGKLEVGLVLNNEVLSLEDAGEHEESENESETNAALQS